VIGGEKGEDYRSRVRDWDGCGRIVWIRVLRRSTKKINAGELNGQRSETIKVSKERQGKVRKRRTRQSQPVWSPI
jgi:hypothetical protein